MRKIAIIGFLASAVCATVAWTVRAQSTTEFRCMSFAVPHAYWEKGGGGYTVDPNALKAFELKGSLSGMVLPAGWTPVGGAFVPPGGANYAVAVVVACRPH